MELIRIILFIGFTLGTLLFSLAFLLCSYTIFRPYWSRLFFSYSHKDTKLAEQIIERLKQYKFRVYIDFGVTLPENQLEHELSKTIRRRDICLVLSTANSADSHWVQYEIKRALRHEKRRFVEVYRDVVMLVIDDVGMEVASAVVDANNERMRDYWDRELGYSDKMKKKTPAEQAKTEAALNKGRRILDGWPLLRRILLADVKVFDLRGQFEPAMENVENYLKDNTTFGLQSKSTSKKAIKIVLVYVALLCLFQAVVWGIFWLMMARSWWSR
jgi:hypothetical protein